MKAHFFLLGLFAVAAHAVAPIVGSTKSKALLNSYIVVLKESVSDEALESHLGGVTGIVNVAPSTFRLGGFKGYMVKASKGEIAALAESDDVGTKSLETTRSSKADCTVCMSASRRGAW